MKKFAIAAMATTPLLAACYPMEQAPLVYASKATVGVGISAGTSDNPGLEMILGYKATDVALVPVAVAKYCSDRGNKKCEDDLYKKEVILGTKSDQSSNVSLQRLIDSAKLEMQSADNKVKTLQAEQTELVTAQSLMAERNKAEADLRALQTTPAVAATDPAIQDAAEAADLDADDSEDMNDDISGLNDKISGLNNDIRNLGRVGTLTKDTVDADIGTKRTAIENAQKALVKAEADYKKLVDQWDSDVSGVRSDSLSVYGTFGGSGNASNGKAAPGETATVNAGMNGNKVFATGIAAQNLSEYKGATDCLGAINQLVHSLPADEVDARTNLITSANVICAKPTAK